VSPLLAVHKATCVYFDLLSSVRVRKYDCLHARTQKTSACGLFVCVYMCRMVMTGAYMCVGEELFIYAFPLWCHAYIMVMTRRAYTVYMHVCAGGLCN
jgi:hypothetical protein